MSEPNSLTKSDLQNIIISTIAQQVADFSYEDIYNGVKEKLVGFVYENSSEVRTRCKNTISTLYSFGSLKRIGNDRYELGMSFSFASKRMATA